MNIEENTKLAEDLFKKSLENQKRGWKREEATCNVLQAIYYQNKVIIETLDQLYR